MIGLRQGLMFNNEGQRRVELHSGGFVGYVRDHAIAISKRHGAVSSDDLRLFAHAERIEPQHPNAWDAVFQGKRWECIGIKRSAVITNPGRAIRLWRWIV